MPRNENNDDSYSTSFLGDVSNFMDKHVKIIGYAKYALAGAGLFIIGRSIRISQKFVSVTDIPETWIKNHVRLQGSVRHVEDGILFVEHIPIISRSKKKSVHGYLPIKICGTQVRDDGNKWLQTHVKGKPVWFKMLAINGNGQLEAIVRSRQQWYKTIKLNEYIIKQKLGVVDYDPGSSLTHITAHLDLLRRLSALEAKVRRREESWLRKSAYVIIGVVKKTYNFLRRK